MKHHYNYTMERRIIQAILTKPVFAVQFAVGTVGNLAILMVLFSSRMRHKPTSTFLAAMATADVFFLWFIVILNWWPRELSGSGPNWLQWHSRALVHAASAASSWFVVAVSVERLSAVMSPFKSYRYFTRVRRLTAVVVIVVMSLATTSYQHFDYKIIKHHYAGLLVKHNSDSVFTKVAKFIEACFVVVIPVLLLVCLNITLIFVLRHQHRAFQHLRESLDTFQTPTKSSRSGSFDHGKSPKESLGSIMPKSFSSSALGDQHIVPKQNIRSASERRAWLQAYGRIGTRVVADERRITIIGLAVAAVYVTTHLPSVYVQFAHDFMYKEHRPEWFRIFALFANSLTITGKTLNFALLCVISTNFRSQLAVSTAAIVGPAVRSSSGACGASFTTVVGRQSAVGETIRMRPALPPVVMPRT